MKKRLVIRTIKWASVTLIVVFLLIGWWQEPEQIPDYSDIEGMLWPFVVGALLGWIVGFFVGVGRRKE